MIKGGGVSRPWPKFTYINIIFTLLFLISFTQTIVAEDPISAPTSAPSPSSPPITFTLPATPKYTPKDNILIACGAQADITLLDGRTFKSDPSTVSYLSTDEDVKVNVNSINTTTNNNILVSSSSQLFSSARIFPNKATYKFPIAEQGFHFIRLHFYPLTHPIHNLSTSVFGVVTDTIVLLHDFSIPSTPTQIFKEYLINITSNTLTLKFIPKTNSLAFINAIEVVSVPDDLVSDTASVPPAGNVEGISNYAFEVAHRVNVGGPLITPTNDTLWRTWLTDDGFNVFPKGSFSTRISPREVKYPEGGATKFIAHLGCTLRR